MTADDILELKQEIHRAIDIAIYAFKVKTGITPSAITFAMVNTTTHDDKIEQHVLSKVMVEFKV